MLLIFFISKNLILWWYLSYSLTFNFFVACVSVQLAVLINLLIILNFWKNFEMKKNENKNDYILITLSFSFFVYLIFLIYLFLLFFYPFINIF